MPPTGLQADRHVLEVFTCQRPPPRRLDTLTNFDGEEKTPRGVGHQVGTGTGHERLAPVNHSQSVPGLALL